MTGSEKILLIARLINERLDSLIIGSSIELHSSELERMKIDKNEQIQVLDFLSSKDFCIKYTSKLDYESEDDLEPETLRDISEISLMNGIPQNAIKQEVLAYQTYFIDVMPGFKDTLTSLNSNAIPTSPLSKNPTTKLSLNKRSNSVELTIDGITKPIYKFRSRKSDNYSAFNSLLMKPGTPLTRKELDITGHVTTLRHLPKSMGIPSELIKIFFINDTAKNTLELNAEKILSEDEAAIVRSYVNNKNT